MSYNGVDLIVFDFDGVFTDCGVYIDSNEVESVRCSKQDSYIINLMRELVDLLVLTSETSSYVDHRCKKLKIPVIKTGFSAEDKLYAFLGYNNCGRTGLAIPKHSIIYVGDDLNDLEIMKLDWVYSVAPANACDEIKAVSNYILTKSGGHGAIRELCDLVIDFKLPKRHK